ncbi:hypothetical protein GYMLUDRAFT_73924 [Collybiopsis luxurians FD-317 M1]|uniref:DUF6533 domain-containing protein n=1 Tax=Collybiopsis luxurians FD-317 M1 TaxID=944289 RepID=A0A0D0CDA8_9AGAR|nr:hypothetical protein GYMLUDRAFT_73924 [Collybiopsis luxurians FD-317 M1]
MAGTNYLQFEIQYASIVLIWYDWILMLPMEVKYIWGAKIRISTIIYILSHYALLANVLYLLAISKVLKQRVSVNPTCDVWYKIIGCSSVLGRAAIIFSFVARAYAVWGRRRVVFLYLASIGIICVGLDIAHLPGLKCVGSSTIPIANDLLSILMVIFEFSSAILVSVRCIQAFRERNRSQSDDSRTSFWDLTFQQGALECFAGFYQRLLNALTLPVSGLLTSRFILHLRKCEYELSASSHLAVASANTARSESILSTIFEPEWDPVEANSSYSIREENVDENRPEAAPSI